MAKKLIIIRGNSGSGKTTIANQLRLELGDCTMLVSQDTIRREILKVKDGLNNPSIKLIYDTVMFGNKIGYDVILEGILAKKHYGKMLDKLIHNFEGDKYVYYFDIPFSETLRRHDTKSNANNYGEVEMRQWWNDKDYLHIKDEKHFDETKSENEIIEIIINNLK